MATKIDFKDGEQIIGYLEIDSGSILFADGIVDRDTAIDQRNRLVIDLDLEHTRLPIVAAQQGEQRFLLIPLDAAEQQTHKRVEKVEVEDQLEDVEEPKDV